MSKTFPKAFTHSRLTTTYLRDQMPTEPQNERQKLPDSKTFNKILISSTKCFPDPQKPFASTLFLWLLWDVALRLPTIRRTMQASRSPTLSPNSCARSPNWRAKPRSWRKIDRKGLTNAFAWPSYGTKPAQDSYQDAQQASVKPRQLRKVVFVQILVRVRATDMSAIRSP